MDVHVRPYAGARMRLRHLFRLAEDSDVALDGYIDAGDVLVATVGDAVVGHLQLTPGIPLRDRVWLDRPVSAAS